MLNDYETYGTVCHVQWPSPRAAGRADEHGYDLSQWPAVELQAGG